MSKFIVKRISTYEVEAASKEAVRNAVKSGFLKNNLKPVKKTFVINKKHEEDND